MHNFTFNGICSEEFGLVIKDSPKTLSRPKRKYISASVPGRNGNLYVLEDTWEEVEQSYDVVAEDGETSLPGRLTEIMEWLHSADDYAELTNTMDPDHYMLAVCVDAIEVKEQLGKWGRATIKFRCRPERFLTNDEVVLDLDNKVERTFVNVQTIYLYDKAGTGGSIIATAHMGDTVERHSTVTVPSTGTTNKVTTIYAEADSSSEVIGQEQSGVYCRIGWMEETGSETYYYVITDNSSLEGYCNSEDITVSSSIEWASVITEEDEKSGYMVNQDLDSEQAILYVNRGRRVAKPTITITNNGVDETFVKINNIRFSMIGHVFDTLTIDCENEDIRGTYTEGGQVIEASFNQYTTVTDVYGDASPVFPSLKKGNNYISFMGSTRSAVMHTHEWEM